MSKADKTRNYIIQKTAPLFNTKGISGTKLSDLTKTTGLTKGSIYGNFDTKDEVAIAAFDHNIQYVRKLIIDQSDKQTSFRDKLLAQIDVFSNCIDKNEPVGGCPLLNTAVEADDTHPILKEKASNALETWISQLTNLIHQGKSNNEFNSNVDASKMALTIIALLEGTMMITKLSGNTEYKSALVSFAKSLVNDL